MSENPLYRKSFISITELTPELVERIMGRAHDMETDVNNREAILRVPGRLMVRAFFEPSTRTAVSFGAAMARLGGQVISLDGGIQYSSAIKGETFEDTVRTLVETTADVIVLRHPDAGSAARAVAASQGIPIINAGDGVGEHPTQALLDLYTIRKRLPPKDKFVVTMLGDLKHGRTVHSLVRLLGLMYGRSIHFNFVSPPSLRMPEDVCRESRRLSGQYMEEDALKDEYVRGSDVLYVTRVQKERFATPDEYETVRGAYAISRATLEGSRSSLVLMHPFPRVDELSTDLDNDPRSAYFEQIRNGVFVRMALLDLILRPSA